MQVGEVTFSEENINDTLMINVTCINPPAAETTCVPHHEHVHVHTRNSR